MNPLLQLEGVSLRYQTAEAETVAIERLDLSVAPRRIRRHRRPVGLRQIDRALHDRGAFAPPPRAASP